MDLTYEEADELSLDPEVLSVEQDCRVSINAIPNDSQYGSLWTLPAVHLDRAWDLSVGSRSVIVAVSDTGIDYTHPDLAANIHQNNAEINGTPGYDDDMNGCIDDYYGCDTYDSDGDPMPGTGPDSVHGTHVAGIIGAVGNNATGVVGASWNVSLIAAKGFPNDSENTSISALLRSVYYAAQSGAKIINCSWGISRKPTQAEIDAFQYALSLGVLPIVAAGNEGVDAANSSPAAIPGVLTVGSINSRQQISSFSNYGSRVSIYAPGGDSKSMGGPFDEYVLSTFTSSQGYYGKLRGTSMATPLVTGVAALALAANPSLSASQLRDILIQSADEVSSQRANGIKTPIRVLDAERAVQMALGTTPTDRSNTSAGTPGQPYDAASVAPPSGSSKGCALSASESTISATNSIDWIAQGIANILIALTFGVPLYLVSRLRKEQ